ncbi:MAG: BamA/TamA family outer membrane protein [Acidobacteria bacterium]|nr:BamA/TamA family outer membrane protein [Acidobacteriota bacterium]
MTSRLTAAMVAAALWAAPPVFAQTAAPPTSPALQAPAAPTRMPPSNSPPLVRVIELRFPAQGNQSVIDPQTYLYYLQSQPSRPSDGVWVPYNEQTVLDDYRRLWNTNFLEDLSVDVSDMPYDNGVIGKRITFNLEERQRVKIVDYEGSKKVEATKIDEKLKEKGIAIRLDSFIDPGLVQRVAGTVRDMLAEKGYQFAKVTPDIKELPGGPKLVHLTFRIDEGPKVKIRQIEFLGNQAIGDGTLKRKMKETKQQWWLSFISSRGTYQESKFEDDAEKVVEHYRDKGYIMARVGQPDLKYLRDSPDGKTRWVRLEIPVQEGKRYRVGDFKFDFGSDQSIVKVEALRPLFKMKAGDYYSEKVIRKGLEKARELYGSAGYFEFVAYPDLSPRDVPTAPRADADDTGGQQPDRPRQSGPGGPPIVDVTMRVQQGQQYFVNRITFVGNTTTRDNVIRRELRLFEEGVFNTEALKYSVRRLNQLGYFKALEQKDISVDKSPDAKNQVDVTLKLEEQNRNQLTFGAGVSQFEGFFGQLSFQTATFLGRGETFTISMQAGSRAQNYQLAFTEPFLFDRPITGGVDLFKREIRYISQFTQDSIGGNLVFGFPVADFTRMFMNYSYEQVQVRDINAAYCDPLVLARNPFLRDSLLLGGASCEGAPGQVTQIDPLTGLEITTQTVAGSGRRTISKISPSLVHNTVDNPLFPTTGRRYTAVFDLAGFGGNTSFYKPRLEGVWYLQQSRRTSVGLRAEFEYIRPYGSTQELPLFEKLFLGGEYSIRGFDIRSIGPRDEVTGLVIGGNKLLLFNAEYLISVAGPVRLVLFYDAGQVQDRQRKFNWNDFKTSTGAEVRFFMPVLNVPFRLIFAYNPQREGVLNNNLEPQKKFQFRFAVGSTF